VSDDQRLHAVLSSLADPTRRRVVEELAHAPASASALARTLPVSRQAVAKHLDALGRAGLVEPTRVGREVRYQLRPAPLAEVADWATRVGAEWEQRLAALDREGRPSSRGQ
jgi:DNA-binding transcriptional ArsR family regulator